MADITVRKRGRVQAHAISPQRYRCLIANQRTDQTQLQRLEEAFAERVIRMQSTHQSGVEEARGREARGRVLC